MLKAFKSLTVKSTPVEEELQRFQIRTKQEDHQITDISETLHEKGITYSKDYLALVIDNFLSKAECDELIKITEAKGYEQALVNIGNGRQRLMTDVRTCDRCIIDDERIAELFYQKTRHYIPESYMNSWIKCSINERLRFLKYEKGGYFKPHHDGCYQRPDGKEQSFVTFFLFLNEDCRGGSSTFVNPRDSKIKHPCEPKTGRLIIFQHNIFHEGSLVEGGMKYAVRSDFMYRRDESK